MNIFSIILYTLIGIIVAFSLARLSAWISNWLTEKKLKKDAIRYADGELDNIYELDGEKMNVQLVDFKEEVEKKVVKVAKMKRGKK